MVEPRDNTKSYVSKEEDLKFNKYHVIMISCDKTLTLYIEVKG